MDGYEIAQRLGREAYADTTDELTSEGRVYFLEDGAVMKVTASEAEAAVALAIMDAPKRVLSHPAVPAIHDVRWFPYALEIPGGQIVELRKYAIVREDFPDIDFAEFDLDESHEELWTLALSHLEYGWRERKQEHVDEALRLWAPHGCHVEQILDGLQWLETTTGIRVWDVRPRNVGVSPANRIGMRDLGRAEVPPHLLELALSEPEAVPEGHALAPVS